MNRWRGALVVASGVAVLTATACRVSDSREAQSYEMTGAVSRLVVDDSAGRVNVTVGDGPVQVTETMRYGRQRPTTAHTIAAGTVHLSSGDCWAVFDRGCEVGFDVRVPAGTTVEIRANAGAVSVQGPVGDLQVTADAGEVRATELTNAHTTVRANVGQVLLRYESVPSNVEVYANAGDIEVRVPGGTAYTVDARAQAGHREIAVPTDSGSAHRITVDSHAGRVRVLPA